MPHPADAVLGLTPLTNPLPLPLLITGVSGVAGYNALFYFQRRHPGQVIGIRPRQTFRLVGPGVVALDAENEADLDQLFREHSFRSVLNTTGNCALKSCELAPDMAYRTNVSSAAPSPTSPTPMRRAWYTSRATSSIPGPAGAAMSKPTLSIPSRSTAR